MQQANLSQLRVFPVSNPGSMTENMGQSGALGEENAVQVGHSHSLPLRVEIGGDAIPGTEEIGLEEDGEDDEAVEGEDEQKVAQ